MATVIVDDDALSRIVIGALQEDLTLIEDADVEIRKALLVVLKYYMPHDEYKAMLKKQCNCSCHKKK